MNRKLRVLLMQLPVPNNPSLNTPLAAGYLKAYAQAQGLLDRVEIDVLPRYLADYAGDAALVAEIAVRQPDVLGLSLYTWNSERSLAIALRVKEQIPGLRVVVGGPEVQRDNAWILEHPAVDVTVIGEGEQTFADLLRFWLNERWLEQPTIQLLPVHNGDPLAQIPGIAYRSGDALHFTAERVSLSDLAAIPSPYLLGYLDVPADGMLMVEVSRWCPYACSFCLYGRNMGPKLGNRYFNLERVLAEITWGREQGVTNVHFVEANLNLVPLFWPLMHALANLNADQRMAFYAELRGEHLTDAVVAALDRANVRYVEVGLQTANPAALRASYRRTDLQKWAAGTRRLYEHGIEVYLDVIVGLPADTEAGISATLDFIEREGLGPYDVFTLQVLPGTTVRQEAADYGLRFQNRPPYYVLATDRLSYADLRRLRRELKRRAGLPVATIEGMPEPRTDALIQPRMRMAESGLIRHVWLESTDRPGALELAATRLAQHVDLVLRWEDLAAATPVLTAWIAHNPTTIIDLYVHCADDVPTPTVLQRWREQLPYRPGYLDRVAVYLGADAGAEHVRVSPRLLLVLPWTIPTDPDAYQGVAQIIWRFELAEGDEVPFGAWFAAGGAGIWLHFQADCTKPYRERVLSEIREWERETGRVVWPAEPIATARTSEATVYSGRI